jgi:hypothetical protein
VKRRTIILLLAGAFLVGAVVSHTSFAFAEDEANPFRAIWDSIDSLNSKTSSLQAQIDEMKVQKDIPTSSDDPRGEDLSDVHVSIVPHEVDSDGFHIDIIVNNDGPSDAVGVKLTAFYKMSLVHIQYISTSACVDMSRGIIECQLGTIRSGEDSTVSVIATDITGHSIGESITLTTDVSSINGDSDYTDNHQVFVLDATENSTQIHQDAKHSSEEIAEQPAQNSTEDLSQVTTRGNENATAASDSSDEGSQSGNENATAASDSSDEGSQSGNENATAASDSSDEGSQSGNENATAASDSSDEGSQSERQQKQSHAVASSL